MKYWKHDKSINGISYLNNTNVELSNKDARVKCTVIFILWVRKWT